MVFWILSFRESSFSNNYSQIFQKELSETGSEKKGKKKLDLWLLCILKKRKSLFNTKRSRRAKFEKKKIFWRASSPEIWKNCSFFIISIWLFFKFFFIVIFVFLSWISEDKYIRDNLKIYQSEKTSSLDNNLSIFHIYTHFFFQRLSYTNL